jgi:6,7-dimethyl-8-ribityllumazine synthase
MPSQPPIAIMVSRYNESVTSALVKGAVDEYVARGGKRDAVAVFDAPGSFELTHLSSVAAGTGRYAGVVALGCLIHGETRHDRYIAAAVANGLTEVSLRTGIPVAFGVLTTETAKQARARSGGRKGNKGREAMAAVLDSIAVAAAIRGGNAGRLAAQRPDKAGAKK